MMNIFQDVQQTQPIFEVDDGQKSYNPFDDPMMHAKEAEKDLLVQKTMSPKVVVQEEDKVTEEAVTDEPETANEKPGFWKKFGDKAKGIFG